MPKSTRSSWKTLLVACAAFAGGCATTQMPWDRPVGNFAYEQRQIQKFDPYPRNDIGPRMEGVRPPDFTAPVADPTARKRFERLPAAPAWTQPYNY